MALAHEWLAARAGSEKTFEVMAEAFPQADLYALTCAREVQFDFGGRSVITTPLDRVSFLRVRRDLTLPLMPLAWKAIKVNGPYDIVVTSSHACVKAFPPAKRAHHYCYCHSPMRYAWEPDTDDRRAFAPLVAAGGLEVLRRWDRRSAEHVDHFAANSTAVRERIRRIYKRDAQVIFPPVDVDFYTPDASVPTEEFALAVGRFIPYKRFDMAIDACRSAGIPLVLAGSGALEGELRARASDHSVRLELQPSDERLRELYRRARVLIFPGHEDFGIIPVEAQACGTPVVALALGGARDTVVEGVTGRLVADPTPESFAATLRAVFESPLQSSDCRKNAERFSRQRFIKEIQAWISASSGDGGGRSA